MRGHHHKSSFVIVFLLLPHIACADVIISEIMYDPVGSDSDREWVEVYNTGTQPVSLVGDMFRVGGKNHPLAGATHIDPHGYAIIVQQKDALVSEYTCDAPIMTTSFSLPNSTSFVSVVDANGTVLAHALYSKEAGANNDGNSLQREKEGDAFVSRRPSPCAGMSDDAIVPPSRATTNTPVRTKHTTLPVHPSVNTASTTAPAAVRSADPPVRHTQWGLYAALALGIAAVVGLVLEAIKTLKKDEWNIEDAGE